MFEKETRPSSSREQVLQQSPSTNASDSFIINEDEVNETGVGYDSHPNSMFNSPIQCKKEYQMNLFKHLFDKQLKKEGENQEAEAFDLCRELSFEKEEDEFDFGPIKESTGNVVKYGKS